LIIDDFLANGEAAFGLMDLIKQAKAHTAGIGIVIEKGFQDGGKRLRDQKIHLESLAIIESMDEKGIIFR
jgi:xanthine phosphoribosyltransferase